MTDGLRCHFQNFLKSSGLYLLESLRREQVIGCSARFLGFYEKKPSLQIEYLQTKFNPVNFKSQSSYWTN